MSVTLKERISNYRKRIKEIIYGIQIWLFTRNNIRHEDISKHIIISGFYRGGTTWLAEILSKITGFPIIWEPFHFKISPQIKKLNIDWKFSINKEEEATDIKDYLNKILRLKILSPQLLRVSDIHSIKQSSSIIFKFCRLNMSLPWFLKNFPQTKVIYLIRNPFAVVASQLEHPAWEKVFNNSFPMPAGRYTDHIMQHKDYLESLSTKAERLAADWSLDVNNILINNTLDEAGRVMIVYYEDLLRVPNEVMDRILTFYGLNPSLSNPITFSSKSISSLAEVSTIEPLVQINKWRSQLSGTEIESIYQVTKKFGVEKVYEKSDSPLFTLQK